MKSSDNQEMNLENVSALVIRLYGVYQIYWSIDDIVYMLAKKATDPSFTLYHYYAIMTVSRIFIGLGLFCLALPLGKRIIKGLL
jgi:hypothetical protein